MNKVSVIIPFTLNQNQKYLDLCLESLQNQEHKQIEVIVVSNAPEKPNVHNARLIETKHPHFSAKINTGVDAAENPDYIIIGNDDTVYPKNSIVNMISVSKKFGDSLIMNPMSNCDNGRLYLTDLPGLKTQMTYEEFVDLDKDLKNALLNGFYANQKEILMPNNLCMYSTFVPIKIWKELGQLDENYRTGYEDTDYCMRANKNGCRTFVNMSSFVFHFSGKTADTTIRQEDRRYNEEYFKKKWGIV